VSYNCKITSAIWDLC